MQRTASMLFLASLCMMMAACGEHPGGDCVNCLLTPQQIEQGESSPFAPTPQSHMACVGTPTPCSQYSNASQCAAVRGCQATYSACVAKACQTYPDASTCNQNRCRWRFACGGQANSCYQATQQQCQRTAGCTWLADSQVCSGVERSCGTFNDPVSCVAQTGCKVLRGCTESLVAPTCLLNTNEAHCTTNNACTWEPDSCQGAPAACGASLNETACKRVSGCAWEATR